MPGPASAGSRPLLRAESLSLERGGRLLFEGLSLSVVPGELVQIHGGNGTGKTSLLRILAGLSRYGYEGSVTRPRVLIFVGHQSAVKSLLTPRENLAWHVAGEGNYPPTAIEAALARVDLSGYEDVPTHTLSAGQQRRVNLARLYLSDTRLWLLDEPFTAIDSAGVRALEQLLVEHADDGGAAILTSHQPLRVDRPVTAVQLGSEALG